MVNDEMSDWLRANALSHADSMALAEACAAAHGLDTVPYCHDDGTVEPVPFAEWTSPDDGDAHPLYSAAADAHDAAVGGMDADAYGEWCEE